ncbi:hypothetical protein RRG08_056247 [Elysia crispata]|uniref:Uncharacterized protein n=1 Tax=Elysia crispata TaxID=231223 RepID=A0AAE1AWW6_9GAST|nr:hypothetical protein RRG08_056247 [Elysia crispata]
MLEMTPKVPVEVKAQDKTYSTVLKRKIKLDDAAKQPMHLKTYSAMKRHCYTHTQYISLMETDADGDMESGEGGTEKETLIFRIGNVQGCTQITQGAEELASLALTVSMATMAKWCS